MICPVAAISPRWGKILVDQDQRGPLVDGDRCHDLLLLAAPGGGE
jgi:hypothetical protein